MRGLLRSKARMGEEMGIVLAGGTDWSTLGGGRRCFGTTKQEDVVVAEQVKSKGAPSELVQGTEPLEQGQGRVAWLGEPEVGQWYDG